MFSREMHLCRTKTDTNHGLTGSLHEFRHPAVSRVLQERPWLGAEHRTNFPIRQRDLIGVLLIYSTLGPKQTDGVLDDQSS